jgi:hypothetical protein
MLQPAMATGVATAIGMQMGPMARAPAVLRLLQQMHPQLLQKHQQQQHPHQQQQLT